MFPGGDNKVRDKFIDYRCGAGRHSVVTPACAAEEQAKIDQAAAGLTTRQDNARLDLALKAMFARDFDEALGKVGLSIGSRPTAAQFRDLQAWMESFRISPDARYTAYEYDESGLATGATYNLTQAQYLANAHDQAVGGTSGLSVEPLTAPLPGNLSGFFASKIAGTDEDQFVAMQAVRLYREGRALLSSRDQDNPTKLSAVAGIAISKAQALAADQSKLARLYVLKADAVGSASPTPFIQEMPAATDVVSSIAGAEADPIVHEQIRRVFVSAYQNFLHQGPTQSFLAHHTAAVDPSGRQAFLVASAAKINEIVVAEIQKRVMAANPRTPIDLVALLEGQVASDVKVEVTGDAANPTAVTVSAVTFGAYQSGSPTKLKAMLAIDDADFLMTATVDMLWAEAVATEGGKNAAKAGEFQQKVVVSLAEKLGTTLDSVVAVAREEVLRSTIVTGVDATTGEVEIYTAPVTALLDDAALSLEVNSIVDASFLSYAAALHRKAILKAGAAADTPAKKEALYINTIRALIAAGGPVQTGQALALLDIDSVDAATLAPKFKAAPAGSAMPMGWSFIGGADITLVDDDLGYAAWLIVKDTFYKFGQNDRFALSVNGMLLALGGSDAYPQAGQSAFYQAEGDLKDARLHKLYLEIGGKSVDATAQDSFQLGLISPRPVEHNAALGAGNMMNEHIAGPSGGGALGARYNWKKFLGTKDASGFTTVDAGGMWDKPGKISILPRDDGKDQSIHDNHEVRGFLGAQTLMSAGLQLHVDGELAGSKGFGDIKGGAPDMVSVGGSFDLVPFLDVKLAAGARRSMIFPHSGSNTTQTGIGGRISRAFGNTTVVLPISWNTKDVGDIVIGSGGAADGTGGGPDEVDVSGGNTAAGSTISNSNDTQCLEAGAMLLHNVGGVALKFQYVRNMCKAAGGATSRNADVLTAGLEIGL